MFFILKAACLKQSEVIDFLKAVSVAIFYFIFLISMRTIFALRLLRAKTINFFLLLTFNIALSKHFRNISNPPGKDVLKIQAQILTATVPRYLKFLLELL